MKITETAWVVEVEPGDTLGSIAKQVCDGDWRKLFAINRERITEAQRKRGIQKEQIPALVKGADRSPPVEAHLIYPGTLLLCP